MEHRIEASAARDRQRTWLLTTVVLAQTLINLALVPAYVIPQINPPMLASVIAALVVFAAAFIINRRPSRVTPAIYTLIVGGGLVTTAQVFLIAFQSHSGMHTAQMALFFVPVIIEAGLFLSPELTLFIAGVSAALTASSILIAIAQASGSAPEPGDAYQIVVYALGVEVLAGYLSWQLSTFIYEKLTVSQTADDLRFAQARLEAFQRQMADQRRQLQRDAGQIQASVSGMLSHEYDVQVDIPDGELAPLAASLNLLFERLRSTNELERRVQRMEADVAPLVDIAGRLGDPGTPAQPSELGSDTALFPVSVALTNAHAAQARRLAQLFQLTSDVVDGLRDDRRVLDLAATDSAAARRQAGELVTVAEQLTNLGQRESELIGQARRLLARLLPHELTVAAPSGERDPLHDPTGAAFVGTGDLAGLGMDIGVLSGGDSTDIDALPVPDAQAAGIAPLTVHMQALDESAGEQAPAVFAPGEIPGELVDSWELLRQLHIAVAAEQRHVATLARDMGMLSRLVRQTDTNVGWTLTALDTSLRQATQAQALSGGANASPVDVAEKPASPSGTGRAPLPTRPLEAENRLSDAAGAVLWDTPTSTTPPAGSIRTQDLIGSGDTVASGLEAPPPDQAGGSSR